MNDFLEKLFSLKGKNVLITGATGFFGRYIARTFLEVGAKVVLLGRNRKLESQVKDYCRQFGNETAFGYVVDFYERKKFKNVLEQIVEEREIDVVVNNAYDLSSKTGFNTKEGRLESADYEQWKMAFESGVYWAVLTTQIIGQHFIKKQKGNIINISSMYGLVSPHPSLYEGKEFFNPPSYGVNKAGLIALTRYTASFWGKHRIRCNAICPGPFSNIESETTNSVKPMDPFLDRLKSRTVLGRLGHPNDLQGALIYLASDASSYMTGQALAIDGGWTIT